jgi:hypothetical protein
MMEDTTPVGVEAIPCAYIPRATTYDCISIMANVHTGGACGSNRCMQFEPRLVMKNNYCVIQNVTCSYLAKHQ